MLEKLSIDPGATKKSSMDFLGLREEAMEMVRKLAGDTWTDHNLHDPGITILEQLCYALTDLGYRLNFSVPQLLADAALRTENGSQIAWKKNGESQRGDSLPAMPPIEAILPASPQTVEDWRSIFWDIEGARSMNIYPLTTTVPKLYFHAQNNEMLARKEAELGTIPIPMEGLYKVEVDTDEGYATDVRRKFLQAFYAERPLCEEIQEYQQLEPAKLSLIADLVLEQGVSPAEVLAEMFFRLDQSLSPQAKFYRLDMLQKAGKTISDIYDGPLLKSGFLRSEDLKNSGPRKFIYLSQIYESVYAVPGIKEVRNLVLNGTTPNISTKETNEAWVPKIGQGAVPRLDLDMSQITLRFGEIPATVKATEVIERFGQKRIKHIGRMTAAAAPTKLVERDRGVRLYQSIQHQFPDNYGINAAGLPHNSGIDRLAKSHQLKTWLLFFEQILANYFSMAGNLGKIFQFVDDENSSFPTGDLADVPQLEDTMFANKDFDEAFLQQAETKAQERLQNLLEHLLARFGESLKINLPTREQGEEAFLRRRRENLRLCLAYFRGITNITKFRGQGSILDMDASKALAPGGLKERIGLRLGIRANEPDFLQFQDAADVAMNTDFLMVEHILLRPLPLEFEHDNMLFRFLNGHVWKVTRLRGRKDPDSYRYKCYSTGTASLSVDDEIEIVFSLIREKQRFKILEVDSESFTIAVDAETISYGNPQNGSWNKVDTKGANLFADPWSLQVSYIFKGESARFSAVNDQREAEENIRQETPAHIAIHIQWQSTSGFQKLCEVYFQWKTAYQAYLQDRFERRDAGKRYLRLRSLRNKLLLALIPGEAEPARELDFDILPQPNVTVNKTNNLEVQISGANVELVFELPEIEPEVNYGILKKGEEDNWEDATEIPATISEIGTGIQIKIAEENCPETNSILAISCTYFQQVNTAQLIQKIEILRI